MLSARTKSPLAYAGARSGGLEFRLARTFAWDLNLVSLFVVGVRRVEEAWLPIPEGKLGLGWRPCRRQGRCLAGKAQALEDRGGDRGVGEKRQDLDRSTAGRAAKDIDLVHPTEEFRPRESARSERARRTGARFGAKDALALR